MTEGTNSTEIQSVEEDALRISVQSFDLIEHETKIIRPKWQRCPGNPGKVNASLDAQRSGIHEACTGEPFGSAGYQTMTMSSRFVPGPPSTGSVRCESMQ
jgi:hypothetical protein